MKRGMDNGTAIMIGMSPKRGGKDDAASMGYDGDEMIEEEEEEMEYEYSEEQLAMADDLMGAMQSGDQTAILDAIHGIYMSYS